MCMDSSNMGASSVRLFDASLITETRLVCDHRALVDPVPQGM